MLIGVCFAVLGIGLYFWFYFIPHQRFHLGMSQSDIEVTCGSKIQIIPLASLLSSPPTEYEKQHTSLYLISIKSSGVRLYLNYYKRVVCIEFAIGDKLGTNMVVQPGA